MLGEPFEANLRLLGLGGCDAILGVDWMKEVSPISFDFNRMEVSFEKGGRRLTLFGGREAGVCKMIIGKRLQKVFKNKWGRLTQLFSIMSVEEALGIVRSGEAYFSIKTPNSTTRQVQYLALLDKLLIEFNDLFQEPKGLPPTESLTMPFI